MTLTGPVCRCSASASAANCLPPPTVGGCIASAAPEIGWHLVHSDDSRLDGAWFQWHYDRWVMPPGAVEVARNAAASQAFVLRRNLALQFHPELDAAGLKDWLEFGGCRQAQAAGSIPPSSSARPRRWGPIMRPGPAGWWMPSLIASRLPRTRG